MEQKKLALADISISPLTIGCWSFGGEDGSYWGAQSQQAVNELVAEALDNGINTFDTAFGYNDGRSEQSLGEALGRRRQEAVIINKIPLQTAEQLPRYRQAVEDSLKRLQTDQIDLMLIHWPTRDRDLLRANLEALQSVQANGLVRAVGVSNFGPGALRVARDMGVPVVLNELAYNLMTRAIESEVLPVCLENQIGIAAYMPLMQGILTGKYESLADIPSQRRRSIQFDSRLNPESRHGGTGAEAEVLVLLDAMRQISDSSGIPQSILATAWILAKPGVSTVVAGCRSVNQLRENARAVETRLPADVLAALDRASQPLLEKMDGELDLWQSGSASRIW